MVYALGGHSTKVRVRESGGLGYYNAGMRAGENEFRPLVAAFGSVQP